MYIAFVCWLIGASIAAVTNVSLIFLTFIRVIQLFRKRGFRLFSVPIFLEFSHSKGGLIW